MNKLESLEGAPNEVAIFSCGFNNLTSIKWSPKIVRSDFYCNNNKLKSLEGSPKLVGGHFSCGDNQIMDFKVPEFSLNENKSFYCLRNPIYKIYRLFNTPKCIDLINEYSAVQGDKIIWDRLVEVFHGLNIEVPDPNNLKFGDFNLIF